MIRRITWKLMSKHVDGLDEEMVEELHQLFLRMKILFSQEAPWKTTPACPSKA